MPAQKLFKPVATRENRVQNLNPVINNEEFIGKTVGRRKQPADPFAFIAPMQRALGPLPIKKGVYRFHTHEEADRWLTDRLIRKPVN